MMFLVKMGEGMSKSIDMPTVRAQTLVMGEQDSGLSSHLD